jgi:hypothetical protein
VGTGFLYGDKRHVLTAKHVVTTSTGALAPEITVEVSAGVSKPAVKCQLLDFCDIALIEIGEGAPCSPLEPIEPIAEPKPNEKFRAYGFPVSVGQQWHPGELVGRTKRGEYEILYELAVTAQLSGLSGAPVFAKDSDHVIGVISDHDPETPNAGKMVPLVDFYDSLDFSVSAAGPTWLAVFSEQDPAGKKEDLRAAIQLAKELANWKAVNLNEQESVVDCISSHQNYRNTIRLLCSAEVCVFDLTGYEPATMLLLGIRSVVRRGVTIGSTCGGVQNAPYDIKELSLLDHSQPDSEELNLANVISTRISKGIEDKAPEHYLDLPSFEAVRNLPPNHRGEVLPEERVLLLSSYSDSYKSNLDYIQNRLKLQLQIGQIKSKIYRIIDLNVQSPWLVSQNMYEAIRRTSLCIVDWTGFANQGECPNWPANVFFELGVRIAVRAGVTVCIIQDPATNPDTKLTQQQDKLIKLFDPIKYRLDDKKGEAFAKVMKLWDAFKPLGPADPENPSEYTYAEITNAIDPQHGLTTKSVLRDLLLSAELLGANDSEGLSGLLYPGNRNLRSIAERAVEDRLWAAWYFVKARYSSEDIRKDTKLKEAVAEIQQGLVAALGSAHPALKDINELLKQVLGLR